MEVGSIHEQIRELVTKLKDSKEDVEIFRLGKELRILLRLHELYVRRMAASVADKIKDDPPTSKAAD